MTFDPASREAEASAEIAATVVGRRTAVALVVACAAILATGPIAELASWAARRGSAVFSPLPAGAETPVGWRGELAAWRAAIDELERRFDERSVIVETLRPRVQLALTRYAAYGNERAIVGRGGWLFFRDDLEHLWSRRPGRSFSGDPMAAALDFRDQLARRGVALLMVPTPLKPTIDPGRLTRAAGPPPIRRDGEVARLETWRRHGLQIVDLTSQLTGAVRSGPVFLATDTHWRPEAVELAARELAIRARASTVLPSGDAGLRASAPLAVAGRGDVEALLGLPEIRDAAREVVEIDRPRTPRDDRPASVLLLGDSFSAIYGSAELGWGAGAGLADRLSAQLGLPVDRLLRNSGGASETRRAFAAALREDPERFAALRIVVWQFAARELSQGAWDRVDLPPKRPD